MRVSAWLVLAASIGMCDNVASAENDVLEIPVSAQTIKYEVTAEARSIKLKCNLRSMFRKNKMVSVHEIRWERKKCGYGLHMVNCAHFLSIPWTSVMCKNESKLCDGNTLRLDDPKETDSGYYRCLYKNYMSRQYKIFKMFHVDVYDPERAIEVLQEPVQYDKQIVRAGQMVTFRCRARSLSSLHMMWTRIVPPMDVHTPAIQYGGHKYELLRASGAHYVGNDLYISKMTIRRARISDTGDYYCVIMNVDSGCFLKNKSVSLVVLPGTESNGSKLSSVTLLLWICIFQMIAI